MALPQIGVEALFRMDQFRRGAKEYDAAMGKADRKTKKSIGIMNAQFAGFAGATIGALGAAAAGVRKFVENVIEMGEEVGRVVDIENSFRNLSRSVGVNASVLLSELKRVSRGTVTSVELMTSANEALLARNQKLALSLPRLYQISEAAARATGQQTDFVFKTVVKGITKASPLLIDNASIYLRIGNAVDQYAQRLGVATEALSQAQRQEAILNSVLGQGEKVLEAAGGAATAATDPYRQLKATWDDSATGIKRMLLPALENLAKRMQSVLYVGKVLLSFQSAWAAGIHALITENFNLDKALDAARQGFDEMYQNLSGNISATKESTSALRAQAGAMGDAGAAADELAGKLDDLNKELGEKAIQAALAASQRMEDLLKSRARMQEDVARRLGWRLEDLARARAKDLAKIEKEGQAAIAQAVKDAASQRAELERRLAKDRQRLEVQHQQQLARLRQSFMDSASDAARRNDAIALLQARRNLQRGTRDEMAAHKDRKREQKQQGIDSRAALEKQLKESIAAEKRQAQESLEIAKQRHAEALAELKRAEERRRIEQQIAWQRQLEDFNKAQGRKQDAQDSWYAKERAKLSQHYATVETVQAAHLDKMIQNQRRAQAQMQAWRMGEAALAAPSIGGGTHYRAEGGVDVVNRPTTFVAGEAGPEIHAWAPVTSGVHFSSDPFNINISGVDSTNQQHLKQIFTELLAGVARQIR